jgi:hypothetical protein
MENLQAKNGKNLKRELTVAAFSVLITALVAFIGWGLLDRLRWASDWGEAKKQMQTTSERVEKLETRDVVTRQEMLSYEHVSEVQHQELLTTIRDLSKRVDTLVTVVQIKTRAQMEKGIDGERLYSLHPSPKVTNTKEQ